MAIIHDGNSVPISTTNPLPSSLFGSEIQVPVDIQSRYAMTIATHTGVMFAPSGAVSSTYIDLNGFNEIYPTLKNDASTNTRLDLQWSHDGATLHAEEKVVINVGADSTRTTPVGVVVPTKARYVRVLIYNQDAAPHTISAWAYLKV